MKDINLKACILAVLTIAAIGMTGCSKSHRLHKYLAAGKRAYDAGQYDKAEIFYLNARNIERLDPAAIRQLGIIYQEEGRTAEALAYLQKAIEDAPGDLEAHLKLGVVLASFGKCKESREQATLVLAQEPANEHALLLLTECVQNTNDLQDAYQRLDVSAKSAANSAAPRVARGFLLLKEQKLGDAEREFNAALALDPKDSNAMLGLGNVMLARNDIKSAREQFQKCSELAQPRTPARLRYALFEISIGRFDDARQLLAEVTAGTPDYIPGWVSLMQLEFGQKHFDQALSIADRILARDTVNYDAMLVRGNVDLAKGDGEKALRHFTTMATTFGEKPQVNYQMAMAWLLNRNISKATAALNKAVSADPTFDQAILLLAELNIRTGNAAAAVPSLNNLIKRHPATPQAYVLLGSAYSVQNQPDGAIAAYQKMAAVFTNSPEPLVRIGAVLADQGKRVDARAIFNRARAIDPRSQIVTECLLNLDILDGDFVAAHKRADAEITADPKSSYGYIATARICIAEKDLKGEEAALQKALEIDPSQKVAYSWLARLYVETNRQKEALDRLNSFVARTNDASAFLQIGMIQQQLKNIPAARDAYEKALTVSPEFVMALNNLACLYSEELGQLDKAYTFAEKANQLRPADPYTADTLGWILFKRGEYNRALGLLQEAAAQLGSEPEVQFHLGMVAYMTGDEAAAKKALQQAVASERAFTGKDEAKRRLEILALDTSAVTPAVLANLEQRFRDDPKDTLVAKRLGSAYEKTAAFNKAAGIYQQMIKNNPDNAGAIACLANLYASRLSDPAKALELARQAHKLAPDNPEVSRTLGSLVLAQGDYKWSSSLLEDASQKLPADPALSYDLAWAYYNLGRVSDSLTLMQKIADSPEASGRQADARQFVRFAAVFENPTNSSVQSSDIQAVLTAKPDYLPALMASGAANEAAGNSAESKRLYEQALAKNPLFLPAIRRLALLDVRSFPDDPKTYDLCVKAREAFPADPEVSKTLGIATYRRGEFQRSSELLKEYLRSTTDDPDVLYYLGMAHYRLKQSQESKGELQRALAMNANSSMAEEARRILAELK